MSAVATESAHSEPHTTWWRRLDPGVVALVLVAYVPLLLTRPGMVGADTKTYLYLDPGRLLSRAPFMWDPNVGLGTVTHQNIGYLWPMGPYYFVMQTLGLPDWVAQRLWLGSIILAAGLGVRWMLRELRWEGAGITVAAFSYALSPYLLDYAARISVILLPFAGLPWLIGLAARSLRRGGWQAPAVFALVTLTVGGVNATSLVLVMVGPILWFVHATFVVREVTPADALRAGLRITALTAITSLWWLVGLMIQGAHGIPILRYTETYQTVAAAALAPELLRGLGYWFFYGRDGLGAWTASSVALVESVRALALSYLLPWLGFVSAVLTRFRHRVFFAGIVAIGLVLGVGAHPWDSPSPWGSAFKAWSTSDLGLSFRSTPRAVPLIALGLSVFLGAGAAAVSRWRPRLRQPLAVLLILLICANMAPLFRGQMVDRNLMRDEQLPDEWLDAAAALSEGDPDTRALEFPGIDFAAYRWGNTVDPITPGLTDREFVARELIPYGSPPSANLLNDLDQPFQAGRPDPDTLAPLAQMMGVGDILVRSDLQYERYLTPRPRRTWMQLLGAAGLGEPLRFGDPAPNVPVEALPLDDELEFSTPVDAPDPPPVSLFPVLDPRAITRTVTATDPVLMAGNGAGMVALASSGGLQVDRPLLYSASFAEDPSGLDEQLAEPGASLVITDTNRRQARRWGSVRDNDGYTERTGEVAIEPDRTDNRLELFPGETDADRTVVEPLGGAVLSASDYGNGVTYTAGDRAMNAMDGDTSTAWRVAAFAKAEENYLQLRLDEPVTTDQVRLLQVQGGKNRTMTEVSLTFDGDEENPVSVALDQRSREVPGQVIEFPERTFDTLRVTIDATDLGLLRSYKGISDVGIAELTIPGVAPVREIVRPPVALLDAAGPASIEQPLSYVFSRRAPNPGDVIVADEEPTMQRWVIGPVRRSFTAFGWARVAVKTEDSAVDRIIGLPSAAAGGVDATSSARMPGTVASRASVAIDGDDRTAFLTPINQPTGTTVEYTYGEEVTVDEPVMTVITDGSHSVPTRVSVSVDGGEPISVDLPEVGLGEGNDRGSTSGLTLGTGPLRGTTFRITIDEVTEAASKDWFGGSRTVLPVGIAEIGLPVVAPPPDSTPLDASCRDDLLAVTDADQVGGTAADPTGEVTPVPVRLVGTVGAATSGGRLRIETCGDPLVVAEGRTLLSSGDGRTTGIDVDMVTLSSAAGGAAGPDTLADPPGPGPEPPATAVERTGRLDWRAQVTGAAEPYWVVLGQSHGPGWRATTSDGVDLGTSTLINGYANGWRIDPDELGADVTVDITWTPQRFVWIGLGASAIGVLICLVLALRRPRNRTSLDPEHESELPRPELPLPMRPVPVGPGHVDGPVWPRSRALLVAAATGAAAFVAGGPQVGVLVAVAVAIGLAVPRGQLLARVGSVGLFGAAALYIVVQQYRNDFQVDFNWVEWFERSHLWGVAATLLLAAAVVLDGLRSRSEPRSDHESDQVADRS